MGESLKQRPSRKRNCFNLTLNDLDGLKMGEADLGQLLDTALGSGDDAGTVNFNLLKLVLSNVLQKLEIENDVPKETVYSPKQIQNDDLKNRIDNIEKALDDLTRSPSPATLIDGAQRGEDAIKNDWEQKKLKKRVDANEDGIDKAHEILDKLAQQIQELKDDGNALEKKLESEQNEQNATIEENASSLKQLNDQMATQAELGEQKDAAIDKLQQQLDEQSEKLGKCVNWEQLDEAFKNDFFHQNSDQESTSEERKEYPKVFEALETISDYGSKIDELLESMDKNSKALDNVKTETDENGKAIRDTNSLVENAEKNIEDLDSKLHDILKENEKLRNDLEKYKAATDRVGDLNELSKSESMKLHDEISSVAESCLDIKKRVKQLEKLTEQNKKCIDEHDQAISSVNNASERHQTILDEHSEQIKELIDLKTDLKKIHSDIDSLNRFKELQKQRNELDSKPGDIDNETINKMQKALSGTEEELSRLADLIRQLSSDGNQKNRELEELQELLRDLQDRAAMRDYVMNNLEKKADATDLEGMLSKDDLDATAQAIIDQLQDLINRQTASEAQLQNTLAQVGDEMQTKTKNDEFNPFKDDIEKRLRALRKKIEASRKEDLEDLTTPAGAAGFRQQLYNCISCDKNIYMRFNKPILPEPSAFPARISLRPHTAYDINSARKTQNSQEAKIDPLRREGSAYSTKVVEKELERRKKLRENKLRQEINNHSFKGSTIPRQVGGPSYYVDKDLRNYGKDMQYLRSMDKFYLRNCQYN